MRQYEPVTKPQIDQRVFDLYDEYCHGGMDRRELLARAPLVGGGLAMAQALLPSYLAAQTISFTDTRIKGQYVSYPSPGGNSGQMRGYLVQPAGSGRVALTSDQPARTAGLMTWRSLEHE